MAQVAVFGRSVRREGCSAIDEILAYRSGKKAFICLNGVQRMKNSFLSPYWCDSVDA